MGVSLNKIFAHKIKITAQKVDPRHVRVMKTMTTRQVPERPSSPQALATRKPLSRSTIHRLIAQGHLIVIANSHVLQLDKWLVRHPGGEKTILHMVGRDATDEING